MNPLPDPPVPSVQSQIRSLQESVTSIAGRLQGLNTNIVERIQKLEQSPPLWPERNPHNTSLQAFYGAGQLFKIDWTALEFKLTKLEVFGVEVANWEKKLGGLLKKGVEGLGKHPKLGPLGRSTRPIEWFSKKLAAKSAADAWDEAARAHARLDQMTARARDGQTGSGTAAVTDRRRLARQARKTIGAAGEDDVKRLAIAVDALVRALGE